MTNKNIQIAVAYHTNSTIIKNDILLPIHVGKATTDLVLDMQADNTGDNISEKNFFYAELTALYWIWKNVQADVKGLLHYRRFIDINKNKDKVDYYNYTLDDKFNANQFLKEISLNAEIITEIIQQYPIITRTKEDLSSWTNLNIQGHYADCHHIEHLEKALEIIKNDYPLYYNSACKTIQGTQGYFANMAIMQNTYFNEYCTWLFDILFKVEKSINLYNNTLAPSTIKSRWAGFLAERLTSIYIETKKQEGCKVFEAPAALITPPNKNFWDHNTHNPIDYTKPKNDNKVVSVNTKNPIISVGIAAYNVELYINKCIQSVCNQTLQNIEIIVINDGSTDTTEQIIKKWVLKDSRVRLVSKSNKGLGDVRNVTIQESRGEYIHFMDGDDYMDTNFLATMLNSAQKHSSDIVISTHRARDQKHLNILYTSSLPHTLVNSNTLNLQNNIDLLLVPCHVWDKLFKTSLIKDIKFPLLFTGEDIVWWYKTIYKANKVSIVRECNYNYLINNASIQTNVSIIMAVFTNIKETYKFLHSTNNKNYVYMFDIFMDTLIGHMVYRAKQTLINNKNFRLNFYMAGKQIYKNINTDIPQYIIDKKEWYSIDYKLINTFKQGSYKDFCKILFGFNKSKTFGIIKIYNKKKIKLFGITIFKRIKNTTQKTYYLFGIKLFAKQINNVSNLKTDFNNKQKILTKKHKKLKYKLIYKLSFGKLRKKYKNKYKTLKAQIKQAKYIIKNR